MTVSWQARTPDILEERALLRKVIYHLYGYENLNGLCNKMICLTAYHYNFAIYVKRRYTFFRNISDIFLRLGSKFIILITTIDEDFKISMCEHFDEKIVVFIQQVCLDIKIEKLMFLLTVVDKDLVILMREYCKCQNRGITSLKQNIMKWSLGRSCDCHYYFWLGIFREYR